MTKADREATRLRRHNEEFRYALARGITILAARHELARQRMASLEERVHPPLKPVPSRAEGAAKERESLRCCPTDSKPHFWWNDE